MGKDNCQTRRETIRFWDVVLLILEVWRYVNIYVCMYQRCDAWKTQLAEYPMNYIYTGHALPCFLKSRPRGREKNRRHFADDIFWCIFFNENVWISILISLKCILKEPISNTPALVEIMARRRSGDKPLFEPMMVTLPTRRSVARPQRVKIASLALRQSFPNLMWKTLKNTACCVQGHLTSNHIFGYKLSAVMGDICSNISRGIHCYWHSLHLSALIVNENGFPMFQNLTWHSLTYWITSSTYWVNTYRYSSGRIVDIS